MLLLPLSINFGGTSTFSLVVMVGPAILRWEVKIFFEKTNTKRKNEEYKAASTFVTVHVLCWDYNNVAVGLLSGKALFSRWLVDSGE